MSYIQNEDNIININNDNSRNEQIINYDIRDYDSILINNSFFNPIKIINPDYKINNVNQIEQILKDMTPKKFSLKYPIEQALKDVRKLHELYNKEIFYKNMVKNKYDIHYDYLYIKNYQHLTNNKQQQKQLKNIFIKTITKYWFYFQNYNYHNLNNELY